MTTQCRSRRPILRPTLWQKVGILVWNLENGPNITAEYLSRKCSEYGVGWIAVKIHDGTSAFHGAARKNLDTRKLDILRSRGTKLLGWGWLTGESPEFEAKTAARLCRKLNLRGYIADAEFPYEFSPRDRPYPHAGNQRYMRSVKFVRAFAEEINSSRFPRALTSYGRVDLHDLDWRSWAKTGWRFLPQAYANESNMLTVTDCARAAEKYWTADKDLGKGARRRRRFIHAMIGIYRGALGRRSVASYLADIEESETIGYSIYEANYLTDEDWPAIRRSIKYRYLAG